MLLIGELIAPQHFKLVALGFGYFWYKHGPADQRKPLDIVGDIQLDTAVKICTRKGRMLGVGVIVYMSHRIYEVGAQGELCTVDNLMPAE